MRLGLIAALVFIVLGLGLLYGSVENTSLVDAEVQDAMNTAQSATKVFEETTWGNFFTALAAPFRYFDSLITIAWKSFDSPLWSTGPWTLVPYFLLAPIVMVFVFGLIILLIGVWQKST